MTIETHHGREYVYCLHFITTVSENTEAQVREYIKSQGKKD